MGNITGFLKPTWRKITLVGVLTLVTFLGLSQTLFNQSFWFNSKKSSAAVSLPPLESGLYWQLGGTLSDNPMPEFEAIDIDGFERTAAKFATLNQNGRYTIAYFSGGSWEDWRPDASKFPQSVLVNDYVGWPGEKWLDVRQLDILRPIMEARADIAKAKGAKAIEWDNIDGFENNPGFTITRAQQLAFNRMLAEITHARGMAAIQKNGADMVPDLLPYFDGCLAEEGYRWGDVNYYAAYPKAGKPLWVVEYRSQDMNITDAKARNIFLALYNLDLDRPPTQWVLPVKTSTSTTASSSTTTSSTASTTTAPTTTTTTTTIPSVTSTTTPTTTTTKPVTTTLISTTTSPTAPSTTTTTTVPVNPISVSFLAPLNGATVAGETNFKVYVNTNLNINRVVLFVDGEKELVDRRYPYNFWLNMNEWSRGAHTIKAKAVASNGTIATTQITVYR